MIQIVHSWNYIDWSSWQISLIRKFILFNKKIDICTKFLQSTFPTTVSIYWWQFILVFDNFGFILMYPFMFLDCVQLKLIARVNFDWRVRFWFESFDPNYPSTAHDLSMRAKRETKRYENSQSYQFLVLLNDVPKKEIRTISLD